MLQCVCDNGKQSDLLSKYKLVDSTFTKKKLLKINVLMFRSSIMNGVFLLSASIFIYFTYNILDQSLCYASQAGLQRDPNNNFRYALFKDHLFHFLDVPRIEGVTVQTWKHCLLRCVKNEQCFSTNIGAFHLPSGNVSCELLPTDKYNASEKFKANHTFHHFSIVVSKTCNCICK